MTNITFQVPEDIARDLGEEQDLERMVLEAVAVEGYRSGKLTQAQVRRLLGYQTRMEVDGFLKQHGVYLEYTLEDLDRESAIGDKLWQKRQQDLVREDEQRRRAE
jgi:predicted HTH domain antitoxin